MQEESIDNLTDKEFVELSGSVVAGTQSGLKAQRAQAELTRRLMSSINNLNKETSRYSDKLIDLTVILFVIAFLQLEVSLGTISASWKEWGILIITSCYILYRVIDYLNKRNSKK